MFWFWYSFGHNRRATRCVFCEGGGGVGGLAKILICILSNMDFIYVGESRDDIIITCSCVWVCMYVHSKFNSSFCSLSIAPSGRFAA